MFCLLWEVIVVCYMLGKIHKYIIRLYNIFNFIMDSSESKIGKSENETFSNNMDINNEHNFQTANMEHKMKKIKNRSKPKMKNNFKNMETFDTLSNEPSKKIADESSKEPVKEVENFDTMNSIFTKKIVEGATNLDDKNDRNNWEGHDDVKDEEEKIDWRDKGVNFVEKVYGTTTYINRKFAQELTYALSNNNPTEKDELLMREYISTLLTAIISLPVTFNWYYVMYCVPTEQLFNLSVTDFKEKSKEEGNGYLKLILFLFEFALFFPSVLNYILVDLIPTYTRKWFSGKINFILVFFGVFFTIKKMALTIKNMLIAIIKDSTSNRIINLMFAAVFINFFVSLFSMDLDELFSFISSPIFYLIKIIIRFILIIIISVPVGAFMMFAYLIIYSLFSIFIYGKGGIAKSFGEVESHSESSSSNLLNDNCYGESFFSIMIRNLMKIAGFLKKNLIMFVLILIIVRYTFIFRTELSSGEGIVPGMTFRDSFMFFNLLLFVTVGTWMYIAFMRQVDKTMKSMET